MSGSDHHRHNAQSGVGSRMMKLVSAAVVAGGLAGCAGNSAEPVANWQTSVASEPQFPESKWKVKASPRVARADDDRARGGYKIGKPYQVGEKWYHPREQPDYDRVGIASWYGANFHGRKTANGEIYDMHKLTAAHPTLPMPSYVYVTNVTNNRTVLVRVNDRGPYVKERMIDLSKAAADALQLSGIAKVRVRYAGPAPLDGDDRRERQFLATGQDPGAPQVPYAQQQLQPAPRLAAAEAPPASGTYAPEGGQGKGQLMWRASPVVGGGPPQMPPPADGEPLWVPETASTPPSPALQYGSGASGYGGAASAPPPQGVGAYSGWDAASYRSQLSSQR